MNRLTHERTNGIKSGYWSQAKKDELIARLAQYENTGLEPGIIADMVRNYEQICKKMKRIEGNSGDE